MSAACYPHVFKGRIHLFCEEKIEKLSYFRFIQRDRAQLDLLEALDKHSEDLFVRHEDVCMA